MERTAGRLVHRMSPSAAGVSLACLLALVLISSPAARDRAPISFSYQPVPFTLQNAESPARYAPETMAGGVALFDYDGDGHLDIYLTNGAEMPALKKTSPKYWNRLLRNDGNGDFYDVTEEAGVAGTGYDTGVAIGDYDNDGDKDLFLAGVHRNTLYRNNGDGTFADVTSESGLTRSSGKHGPWWAVGGAWLDFDNDGDLDLFVVNYLQWNPDTEPACLFRGERDYCHPKHYQGLPNHLYRNNGEGTFTDVSGPSGIRAHVGKGMGAAAADFDRDGLLDIFVANDKLPNFFFHNQGSGKFEEIGFEVAVALSERGKEISGMGADFRDIDNDGWPDITFVALDNETFPLFRNSGKGYFEEVTFSSGLAQSSQSMAGYSAAMYDFDNDGWKDIFVSRGHVQSANLRGLFDIEQHNTVFRNLGNGTLTALTGDAGFTARPPQRHRGSAHGDLNHDGRVDIAVSALGAEAEIWLNRSSGHHHWLELELEGTESNRDAIGAAVKVVTTGGVQYNHVTTAVGYASSSPGSVHFGLGTDETVERIEIRWPSGQVQLIRDATADRVLRVKEP